MSYTVQDTCRCTYYCTLGVVRSDGQQAFRIVVAGTRMSVVLHFSKQPACTHMIPLKALVQPLQHASKDYHSLGARYAYLSALPKEKPRRRSHPTPVLSFSVYVPGPGTHMAACCSCVAGLCSCVPNCNQHHTICSKRFASDTIYVRVLIYKRAG